MVACLAWLQAIAERDSSTYEAQTCKAELQMTSAALKETKARLVAQEQHTQDLQQQLAACRHQVEGLQGDLALARGQLKQLPVVQQQLQQQISKAEQLQVGLLVSLP